MPALLIYIVCIIFEASNQIAHLIHLHQECVWDIIHHFFFLTSGRHNTASWLEATQSAMFLSSLRWSSFSLRQVKIKSNSVLHGPVTQDYDICRNWVYQSTLTYMICYDLQERNHQISKPRQTAIVPHKIAQTLVQDDF